MDIYTESIYLSRARSQIETRAFFEKRLAERTKLLEKKNANKTGKKVVRGTFSFIFLSANFISRPLFLSEAEKKVLIHMFISPRVAPFAMQ